MKKKKIKNPIMKLIMIRMASVFLILGLGGAVIEVNLVPFCSMVLGFFIASIIYLILYKTSIHPEKQIGIQLTIDILLILGVLKYSGGSESVFISMILLPLIASGMMLSRQTSLALALLASVGYVLLAGTDIYLFNTYLPVGKTLTTYSIEVSYLTFVRLLYIWSATLLSSYFAGKLRTQKKDLAKLKKMHNLILDQITSGIITVNKNNEIVYINKGAADLIGATEKELKGQNWKPLFFFTNSNFSAFTSEGTTQEVRGYEVLLKRKDGTKLPIGFNVSKLVDHDNEYCGKVMVFRDLTRIKEIERKQKHSERLAAVGEMAAGIAHELRNPLASISGAVEVVVNKKAFDEKYSSLMDVILMETQRLNEIIENFLGFARRPELEKHMVDIEAVLDDVLILLKFNGKFSMRHKINKVNLIPGKTKFIFDPKQMKQVFYNLISNACEAMPRGGEVTVSISEEYHPVSAIKIEIEDHGCGIDDERLASIFTPFFTTKKMGTGLGLAIVHKIIEEHKGSIEVSSELRKGTKFTILLPREEEAAKVA